MKCVNCGTPIYKDGVDTCEECYNAQLATELSECQRDRGKLAVASKNVLSGIRNYTASPYLKGHIHDAENLLAEMEEESE